MIFHYIFFGVWGFVILGILCFMMSLPNLRLLEKYGYSLLYGIYGLLGIVSILGICSILESNNILP